MIKDKIYKITIDEKHLNTKKVAILLLIVVVAVGLIMLAKNTTTILKNHKVYKQYEAQLGALAKQEESRQTEIEEKKQERIPKLTQEGKENLENIYHAETKRAFLTFDDGPSTVTPTILDILKQEKVKATFFVLGTGVRQCQKPPKEFMKKGIILPIMVTAIPILPFILHHKRY